MSVDLRGSHRTAQRILIVCHDLSDNALSRAMVISDLARHLGWEVRIVGQQTGKLWVGMQAGVCVQLPSGPIAMLKELNRHAKWATCMVACKAYPTSFGIARIAAKNNDVPLVVDIDDLDIEHYQARGWKGLGRALRTDGFAMRTFMGMHNPIVTRVQRAALRKHRVTASSPTLKRLYGGTFIPAARRPFVQRAPHLSRQPVVGFLGTVRPHKGIEAIRAAVGELAGNGYSLVITADAPADAKPWETWTGPVEYSHVLELLTQVDIVVVASSEVGDTARFAAAQLPIKLLDAMNAGRACVVTSFESLVWGLGGNGVVLGDARAESIVGGLRTLADPQLRQRFGDGAAQRAEEQFGVDAAARTFAEVVGAATEAEIHHRQLDRVQS